ncbi:MAG: hypothetical protein ACRYGK_01300, partial [Janthinobacterium lividum]
MPIPHRIAQIANRSTPAATAEDIHLPGKLRSLWPTLALEAQTELVDTLSRYVFHLHCSGDNVDDANDLLLSMMGDSQACMPAGLQRLQVAPATHSALQTMLHSKLSVRSLKLERSRDKLEKLLFEMLAIHEPRFMDIFPQVFEVCQTAHLLQPQGVVLPAHFTSHLDAFKRRILKSISEDREDVHRVNEPDWVRRNRRSDVRTERIFTAFKHAPSELDAQNLPMLQQALREALCHHNAHEFFRFNSAHPRIDLPFKNFPGLLSYMLHSATVSPSLADEYSTMVAAKLSYTKHISYQERLSASVAQDLFDVVFHPGDSAAGLHPHAADKLKAAFLPALRTVPASFHPSRRNIALPFHVDYMDRFPEEANTLQHALLQWLRQHTLNQEELLDTSKDFLFRSDIAVDARITRADHQENLSKIRKLLLASLRATVLNNRAWRLNREVGPNRLWTLISTNRRGTERPAYVQTALDALILETLSKNMITDPEELSGIATAICSNALPLEPHSKALAKTGIDFLIKLVNAQGLGMNDVLANNLSWLEQSSSLAIIRGNPLIVPEDKNNFTRVLQEQFTSELLEALTPGIIDCFHKLDFSHLDPHDKDLQRRSAVHVATYLPFLENIEGAKKAAMLRCQHQGTLNAAVKQEIEALLKPAINTAVSRTAESAFNLVSRRGFHQHLRKAVGDTVKATMPVVAHVHFDDQGASEGIKDAVAAILVNEVISVSAARKTNAIKEAMARHEPAVTGVHLEDAISALMRIDTHALRQTSIIHACKLGKGEWTAVGAAVNTVFTRWNQYPQRVKALALASHRARSEDVLRTMDLVQDSPLFEPYVQTVFPFVPIAAVRRLLDSQRRQEQDFSATFARNLESTASYYEWMARQYMVDQDEQDEPLGLLVSSAAPGQATFVQIADLSLLNSQNQERATFLPHFQIVDFANGHATSSEVTLPLLRKTAMPAYLKEALMSNFTIGPVIAEALLNLCRHIFTTRALVLPGSDMELLQQVMHQVVGQPTARMQIELRVKKRLV